MLGRHNWEGATQLGATRQWGDTTYIQLKVTAISNFNLILVKSFKKLMELAINYIQLLTFLIALNATA